ncbi:MAG: hypothetical protein JWN43_3341, partial [Gammaproteobacteria bacterium]|nr:hypothetical protein [Gammaproteobacteria bacterium]
YAKHDFKNAMTEYKAALNGGDATSVDSALLQLKIADLGAPPAAPAPVMVPAPASKSLSADSSNKAKP